MPYRIDLRAMVTWKRARDEAEASEFGAGRVVTAREAVELAIADRVATFEETLERLQGGGASGRRR